MSRRLGLRGEHLARTHLEASGYRVLALNWRCAYGEVDIIAQEEDTIVFVEVKTRRSLAAGVPEEAVTRGKTLRLLSTAQSYLAQQSLDFDWRVDVIAIEVDGKGLVRRFEHIRDAIQGW